MAHPSRLKYWLHLLAALLATSVLSTHSALAGDGATEQAQLAAVMRQLDMIDRLTEHSANLPRPDNARYHFDYWRLQRDIERVRQGIRDYLIPERAQPRDPLELLGEYRYEPQDSSP